MKPLHEELKELRLGKGISLETINDSMKISMTILEKMEDGDFSVVPQPFIRSFLREYAEVIGIDPERVIARYENKADSIIKTQPAAPAKEQEETESAPEPVSRHKKTETTEPEAQPAPQEVTSEPHKKTKSSGKPETSKKAASEPIVSAEVNERDSEKADSVLLTEKDAATAEVGPSDEQTVPVERQKLEIEESGPMHTVSIVIFVIIIIVAAVVIFWINRGL